MAKKTQKTYIHAQHVIRSNKKHDENKLHYHAKKDPKEYILREVEAQLQDLYGGNDKPTLKKKKKTGCHQN